MLKLINIIFISLIFVSAAFGQENFASITYSSPTQWKKTVKADVLQFSKQDEANKTFALMMLFRPMKASTDPQKNFSVSWDAIVKGTLAKVTSPQMQPAAAENGWTAVSAVASYESNDTKGAALLVSMTGGDQVINLMVLTNTDVYQGEVTAFMNSLVLPKPNDVVGEQTVSQTPSVGVAPKVSSYKYNTSSFNDGWVATEEEDWVRVTKGSLTAFLHYPRQGTVLTSTDADPMTNAAWNILVAPRYSHLRNFHVASPSHSQDRPQIASAFLTENATRREVFVVLFRSAGSIWTEIRSPDKAGFISQFGFDPELTSWKTDSAIFDKLATMPGYNKFPVAQSDLKGAWTSSYTAVQSMYFVSSGAYAGMSSSQASWEFAFNGNNYSWKIVSVNGMVGAQNIGLAANNGIFQVSGDWEIRFSNIEGKPRRYSAFFSAIKNARLLNLNDADHPGSGAYIVFGHKS